MSNKKHKKHQTETEKLVELTQTDPGETIRSATLCLLSVLGMCRQNGMDKEMLAGVARHISTALLEEFCGEGQK